jgi:hypothetical protein
VFDADQTIESSLCIGADGTLYFSARHISYAVNPDGTEKWRSYISDDTFNSEPAIGVNGIIYFGSWDFRFYALYPDGSEYWHNWTEGQVHSSPAIDNDGILYIGRAYSVSAYYTDSYGVANSAWPMYRANLKRTARVEKYWFGMYFVDQLVAVVRRSTLKKGTQNSLVVKLNSAAAALKKERSRPAVNKLNAFVNEVDALAGKKIPDEEAGYFMELAFQAIDAINGMDE